MQVLRDEASSSRENLSLFAFEMEVESKWSGNDAPQSERAARVVATRGSKWSDLHAPRARIVDQDSPFCIAMTTEDLEMWLKEERKTSRLDRRASNHEFSGRFPSLHLPHSS